MTGSVPHAHHVPGVSSGLIDKTRYKEIRKVTLYGLLLNILLIGVKFSSGIWLGSSALLADGFHSLSDLATDLVVLIGNRLSNRPPDESHPYGHSKFDTMASFVIALILLAAGGGIIWSAGGSIYNRNIHRPGFLILIVAGLSVVTKEIIFYATRQTARRTNSSALYANAWHHRSDSLSSIAVLAGGGASLLGWGYADQVAAVVVGFMILAAGGKILYGDLIELTEHAADKETIQTIENILNADPDIKGWHALRTRRLGADLFLDVHILVDADMSVRQSHDISLRIEHQVKEKFSKPVNILIHADPYSKD
ncbi:MAG: cation transporter [Candidatus Aminicenantes bacterium]|nr:cation transporter [Candidatus Aminicenantes bacterium]